jgi:hypothetical protein
MTDCTLTLACDDEAGQVVLEDLPAGPAGEAGLIPANGVELLFDRADGRLSRVFIDAGVSEGPTAISKPVPAFVTSLFGGQASAIIGRPHQQDGTPLRLEVDGDRLADLSRLARLDATRVTSPVAQSPWWAVEASQLAARAGLGERAAAEALHAASALADATDTSAPGLPTAAVHAVADLVQAAEPELAKKLRDHAALPWPGQSASALPGHAWLAVLPHVAEEGGHRGSDSGALQWWLDPQAIPSGVFRYGLWPEDDVTVRTGESGILVEATLAPGADPGALTECRARLVAPANRTVLGVAAFHGISDSRVGAHIHGRVPPGEAWVEIVDDERRPVLSGQLRRIRRAMRWADAALTAARRPPGLGDAEWARLATLAWERCANDWSAAGDADRAYLAAMRRGALSPGVLVDLPASAWAKEVIGRPALAERPFLAETVGW